MVLRIRCRCLPHLLRSITIAAAALLLALPLAQVLPLQRGSFTFIPPYIHNAVWSCFPGISCGSLFARSISPNYLAFLVIFRHSKSGSPRFNSNFSNRHGGFSTFIKSSKRQKVTHFIYVRLHVFVSPNPEKNKS